jgi:putative peptide zinc metalloprotease protein
LFNKGLVLVVLAAFSVIELRVLPHALQTMSYSLLSHEVLYLFLAVAAIGLIHELGHATACARYGAPHGGVGFGLYLVFPAFYADVTKAWRLPPRQRAVVDLGGLYFQCLLLIPLGLIALATRDALLLHVFWVVNFMMLFTLNPVFKMDGYWLLSDLSGLRNLHKRMTETLVILVRKLRRKPLPEQTLTAVTGARRKLLYAYTGLALVYYLYLVPVALSALSVTLWNYPERAGQPVRIAILSIQNGSYLEALQALGSLIHVSIWPAIVGVIFMRLFYKIFKGLATKVVSALRCVVSGLCHCQPAAETESSPIAEGRSKLR